MFGFIINVVAIICLVGMTIEIFVHMALIQDLQDRFGSAVNRLPLVAIISLIVTVFVIFLLQIMAIAVVVKANVPRVSGWVIRELCNMFNVVTYTAKDVKEGYEEKFVYVEGDDETPTEEDYEEQFVYIEEETENSSHEKGDFRKELIPPGIAIERQTPPAPVRKSSKNSRPVIPKIVSVTKSKEEVVTDVNFLPHEQALKSVRESNKDAQSSDERMQKAIGIINELERELKPSRVSNEKISLVETEWVAQIQDEIVPDDAPERPASEQAEPFTGETSIDDDDTLVPTVASEKPKIELKPTEETSKEEYDTEPRVASGKPKEESTMDEGAVIENIEGPTVEQNEYKTATTKEKMLKDDALVSKIVPEKLTPIETNATVEKTRDDDKILPKRGSEKSGAKQLEPKPTTATEETTIFEVDVELLPPKSSIPTRHQSRLQIDTTKYTEEEIANILVLTELTSKLEPLSGVGTNEDGNWSFSSI